MLVLPQSSHKNPMKERTLQKRQVVRSGFHMDQSKGQGTQRDSGITERGQGSERG